MNAHYEYSLKKFGKPERITCAAWHITFGGLCLNCGFEPAKESRGIQPDPRIAEMVSSAAEATERFSEDDLEAYAESLKNKQSNP